MTPDLGTSLPIWSALPFAGMLLSIAFLPLIAPGFWHRHYPKVALAWGLVFTIPFLAVYRAGAAHAVLHTVIEEYLPFVILLLGLFTISGGIVIRAGRAGTPLFNTALLGTGTFLASWIGTTGASMLLIRPLLNANAGRQHRAHLVVFFIFLVSNIGGALTPLGDPPLFLGFLQGVPFFWTFHLLPHMGLLTVVLLGAFYLFDRRMYRIEAALPGDETAPDAARFSIEGRRNFLFLGGVVLAVLASGIWPGPELHLSGIPITVGSLAREIAILALAGISLATTKPAIREHNRFHWGPMKEVAILFAAIFVTMIPAIAILRAGENGHFAGLIRAVREPWQYFWATGILSSFLDNAPTYLTFFHMQLGRFYPGIPPAEAVSGLVVDHVHYLEAVAAGAVFMGACTYIGNAPNFMVKAIAEEDGVPMPSFFGYLFRWTVPFLLPVFVLQSFLFFTTR